MEIAINKIHFPVSTLGFGQRLGIWFQGCSIRCPGCISRDTWEGGESYLTNLDQYFAKRARSAKRTVYIMRITVGSIALGGMLLLGLGAIQFFVS